jgi:tetratricopeptide (TPR) repeat protein
VVSAQAAAPAAAPGFKLAWLASHAGLADAQGRIEHHLRAQGVGDKPLRRLLLVVEEAVMNIEMHGGGARQVRLAIALQPDLMPAYANLGKTLEDLGQPEQAVVVFDQAIAISPDSAAAFYNRGNALKANHQPDAALASYDQAIGLNPAHAETFYNKGVVLQERNQIDPAIAHYRRAIEINPDYALAHWNLATVLLTGAEHARGWEEFEWRWRSIETGLVANRRGLRQPGWLGREALAGPRRVPQSAEPLRKSAWALMELAPQWEGGGHHLPPLV